MHETFLKAIIDQPAADLPRLIYADWLEEQGDPRAEFIRVQCRLAGSDFEPGEETSLRERETRLLLAHRLTWDRAIHQQLGYPKLNAHPDLTVRYEVTYRSWQDNSPALRVGTQPEVADRHWQQFRRGRLYHQPYGETTWGIQIGPEWNPSPLYVWGWVYHRGFPERIDLPAAMFLNHWDAIRRLMPLRIVRLYDIGDRLQQLADCEHLGQPELLALALPTEVTDAASRILRRSRRVQFLRRLYLQPEQVTAAAWRQLAGMNNVHWGEAPWLPAQPVGADPAPEPADPERLPALVEPLPAVTPSPDDRFHPILTPALFFVMIGFAGAGATLIKSEDRALGWACNCIAVLLWCYLWSVLREPVEEFDA